MKLIALPVCTVLAVILGALVAPPVAAATVASSATLSRFTITLVDLDTADGIAPAVSFVGEGGPPFSGFASGRVTLSSLADGSELYTDFYNESGPTAPFSSAAGAASHGGSSVASALIASTERLGPHVFTVQGSATAPAGTQASYNGHVQAPGFVSLTYSVTPFTLVVFEGEVALAASVLGPADTQDLATGSAELFAYGQGPSGGPGSSQNSRDLAGILADAARPSDALSRVMSVSFLNHASTAITGQIKVNVHASGVAVAVPEASMAGLALAGGGVLWGVAVAQRRARIAKRA